MLEIGGESHFADMKGADTSRCLAPLDLSGHVTCMNSSKTDAIEPQMNPI